MRLRLLSVMLLFFIVSGCASTSNEYGYRLTKQKEVSLSAVPPGAAYDVITRKIILPSEETIYVLPGTETIEVQTNVPITLVFDQEKMIRTEETRGAPLRIKDLKGVRTINFLLQDIEKKECFPQKGPCQSWVTINFDPTH